MYTCLELALSPLPSGHYTLIFLRQGFLSFLGDLDSIKMTLSTNYRTMSTL